MSSATYAPHNRSPTHETPERALPATPNRRAYAPNPLIERGVALPTSHRPPRRPHDSRPPRRPRMRCPAPYIPPFRQARLDAAAHAPPPPSSEAAQERAWHASKKRVNGALNRLNIDNVPAVSKALLRLNLIRLRGVFAKAVMRAQLASPSLSPIFACLVAVIGSRLPAVAELVVARLVAQLRAAYDNQDRVLCYATARFFAQLFNQQVVTELLILEFLSTCLLDPTDGSVELAVVTLRECSVMLAEKSPKAFEIVFQRLRSVLHDGDLSRRVQVLIEDVMIQRRKGRTNAQALPANLDLLHEEDIITHFASLEDNEELDLQYECNTFQFDPNYESQESIYEDIKMEILGVDAKEETIICQRKVSRNDNTAGGTDHGSDDLVAEHASGRSLSKKEDVTDMTQGELVDFRRTIYLTISSGLSYEEWAHKLLRLMRSHPGKERHLCQMIVECCSQEKTFLHSYGLLAQRFCLLNDVYASNFGELFATSYATIHRLDTRKIRNIGSLYASLFASDVLSWSLFQLIRIVEDETSSSSRIFLKILFQEIYKTLGERGIKEKVATVEEEGHLTGVFPTDTAENAKFSINFFTSIGLGVLTDELRTKLKSLPENPNEHGYKEEDEAPSSSLSSSSLSSSSLSASSDEGEGRRDEREENSGAVERLENGKRDQSESSLAPSERPKKYARVGTHKEGEESEEDRREFGRRERESGRRMERESGQRSRRRESEDRYTSSSSESGGRRRLERSHYRQPRRRRYSRGGRSSRSRSDSD